MNQLGNRIKQIRLEKNVTQAALSRKTGLHITLISRYERGLIDPTSDSLQKIAKALDISFDYLLDDITLLKDQEDLTDKELLDIMQKIKDMSSYHKRIVKEIVEAIYFKSNVGH